MKHQAQLEKPVDGCIEDVIGFVKEEIEKFVEYVEYKIEELKTKPGKNDTVAEMTETLQKFHSKCVWFGEHSGLSGMCKCT